MSTRPQGILEAVHGNHVGFCEIWASRQFCSFTEEFLVGHLAGLQSETNLQMQGSSATICILSSTTYCFYVPLMMLPW